MQRIPTTIPPQGIRANAEEAGFNPLVFAGPGTGAGYSPVFGNALGDAAALGFDIYNQEKQLELQRDELAQENKRLELLVQNTTLRPKVPGIYGGARAGKSNSTADDALNTRNNRGFDPVSHDQGLDYKGQDFGVIRAQGSTRTSVATNPGYPEHLSQFYGDEVSDLEGALNYAKDWWHGQVRGEVYYPGFGWESQITRPKARPRRKRKHPFTQ